MVPSFQSMALTRRMRLSDKHFRKPRPADEPASAEDALAEGAVVEGALAEEAQDESDPLARIARLEAELAAARAESAEHRNQWLRAVAELDNFRRRTARELEESVGRGRAEVLLEVVKVLDDVDRALTAVGEQPSDDSTTTDDITAKDTEAQAGGDPVVAGIRLIRARLLEILRRYGVVEIEGVGARFDPHLHHAVLQVPTGTVPDGCVAQVLERGYWLGERVLRPAKVAVASEGRG